MKRRSLVVFVGDPPGDSVSVPMDLLPVGVVFFPSLPFMGVVLSPSFVLGDASGEGGTFLVSLYLFSPLLSLPLLSSPSPSLSFSFLFLFFLLLLFSISFSFPFPLSKVFFFFFEGTACTVCFRDVRNDATDCNQLYLYCNKEIFYFFFLNFAHSDVCNLLVHSMTVTSDQIINKHTVRHPKTDNTLFKITTRGLLIKTLKVLSIPSMR